MKYNCELSDDLRFLFVLQLVHKCERIGKFDDRYIALKSSTHLGYRAAMRVDLA